MKSLIKFKKSKPLVPNKRIDGFFSETDSLALYFTILSQSPKSILEIGHFLGKSTAAICSAINVMSHKVEFDSYDLPFTSEADFIEFYSPVHQRSVSPSKKFQKVYKKRTTSTELARMNLHKVGLENFVNLQAKDYTKEEVKKYDFIFSDAVHDIPEITLHLPHITDRSNAGATWVFHDQNEENISFVTQNSNSTLIFRIGSLAIYRFNQS
jgi:hypothetical protein